LAGCNARALPAGGIILNILCYVRSWSVDLESCETLHHGRLKNVSDGKREGVTGAIHAGRNF